MAEQSMANNKIEMNDRMARHVRNELEDVRIRLQDLIKLYDWGQRFADMRCAEALQEAHEALGKAKDELNREASWWRP